MAKRKKTKQIAKNEPRMPRWLPLVTFVALGILIFYPPFFRGLFFKEDMFIYHIFTAIVFTLIWIIKIYKKDYTLLRTPLDWAIIAYAGAYLLSLIGAVHPGEAFYGFLKTLNYFMVFWMVTQVVKNYHTYEIILKILLAAGTGVAVIGILAATGYSNYPSAFDGRHIMSTLQYHNTTAAYLGVLSFVGITLWILEKSFYKRIIYSFATFLMVLVTLTAISKGAWLIFIIGGILLLIGMPGIYRLKAIYSLGLTLITAIIINTKFLPIITGEGSTGGLLYILLGFAIMLLGQILWEAIIYLNEKIKLKVGLASLIIVLIIGLGMTYIFTGSNLEIPEKMAKEFAEIGNLEDMSYITRADFARWGFAIVKDYPVFGTGAGGWNALYNQYQDYLFWTTEVHNHFMQVWVEAGTLGLLAFLSIWGLMLYQLVMIYRQRKEKDDSNNWILIWGTATAALALGAHAAIDFDLSLAAMSLLLWTLFALINSGFIIEGLNKIHKQIPAINITIAVVLSFTMLITGTSYSMAHNHAKNGAITISSIEETDSFEKLQKAINYYERATASDSGNAEYHADLSYTYALSYSSLAKAEHPQAREFYHRALRAMEKAEKLKPYDTKVRNSLLNNSMMLGDIEGMLRHAKGAVEKNPNDINAYETQAKVLWSVIEHYREINENEKAKEHLDELLKIADKINQQKGRLNPNRTIWQGKELKETTDLRILRAKAMYLIGDYKTAAEILKPYATNLLALEFDDIDFENTSLENDNWQVQVVADNDATNGKAVEIIAKKDILNWQTALQITQETPAIPNQEYKLELRYKVVSCEDNPQGEHVRNKLAIWSHWHVPEKSIPSDFIFWDGNKAGSTDGWQVYTNISKAPENATHRHLKLGTGSVKEGTTYRVDYIKFYPVNLSTFLGTEQEEIINWYAASLNKLGEKQQADEIIKNMYQGSEDKLYKSILRIEPL